MNTVIFGAGRLGSAFALRLAEQGHSVILMARSPYNAPFIEDLRSEDVRISEYYPIPKETELVIVALKPNAFGILTDNIPRGYRGYLIDASNAIPCPPNMKKSNLEYLTYVFPKAKACKCFNMLTWHNILNPRYGSQSSDMLVAGSNIDCVQVAQRIAMELGFEFCYHLGDDSAAEILENISKFWMILAMTRTIGNDVGFKFLKR